MTALPMLPDIFFKLIYWNNNLLFIKEISLRAKFTGGHLCVHCTNRWPSQFRRLYNVHCTDGDLSVILSASKRIQKNMGRSLPNCLYLVAVNDPFCTSDWSLKIEFFCRVSQISTSLFCYITCTFKRTILRFFRFKISQCVPFLN